MIEVGAYFYHPIWIQHIQEHKLTDFDDINFSHFPFMNWNASFGCFSEVHLSPSLRQWDYEPFLSFMRALTINIPQCFYYSQT